MNKKNILYISLASALVLIGISSHVYKSSKDTEVFSKLQDEMTGALDNKGQQESLEQAKEALKKDNPLLAKSIDLLQPIIDKSMKSWGVPGAAIAIVHKGKVVFEQGFGVVSLTQNKPITNHTLFQVSSLTKSFTVMILAQLVDEGKIMWDNLVVDYLPNFQLSDPELSKTFTIRDLVSHRSGLPSFSGDTLWNLGCSKEEILGHLNKILFETVPRDTFHYQNFLFAAAEDVIEKVEGKKIKTVFEERIFKPLDMKDSSVGAQTGKTPFNKLLSSCDIALPHDHYFDESLNLKTREVPLTNFLYTAVSTSGVNSSAHDMAKWLLFNLNNGKTDGQALVSMSAIEEIRNPHVILKETDRGRNFPKERVSKIAYGMGWFKHDYLGKTVYTHMGGVIGTRALMSIVPEEELGIVVLSNLGGMRVSDFPEIIRNSFLDLYFQAKDVIDWNDHHLNKREKALEKIFKSLEFMKLQNPAPMGDPKSYVGTYENDFYGAIKVLERKGHLFLQYKDKEPFLIHHLNGGAFTFQGSELGPGWTGNDLAMVHFYTSKDDEKKNKLTINLLFEGTEPYFKRVDTEKS